MVEEISDELLEVLACPSDKAKLELKDNKLICIKCKAVYEIKDGIPVLMPKNE